MGNGKCKGERKYLVTGAFHCITEVSPDASPEKMTLYACFVREIGEKAHIDGPIATKL